MILEARDAKAGLRYRVVEDGPSLGEIVEICASPIKAQNGELTPLVSGDRRFVHVMVIVGGNVRLGSHHNSPHNTTVPMFFKLETVNLPYVSAPLRRTTTPPATPTGAMGRPKLHHVESSKDVPWRGRAMAIQHDMERLLEVIEDESFDVIKKWHYYRVCYHSVFCLAVFKAGQLGFRGKPIGLLNQYPIKEVPAGEYLSWRTDLSVVMAAGKWAEMLDLLKGYLREFKRKVDRRGAR